MTMTRSMTGWTYQEVFFIRCSMLGHTLSNMLFFTVGNVPEYVRDGTFDRYRPAAQSVPSVVGARSDLAG